MTAEWDARTYDPALLGALACRGRASAPVLPDL